MDTTRLEAAINWLDDENNLSNPIYQNAFEVFRELLNKTVEYYKEQKNESI